MAVLRCQPLNHFIVGIRLHVHKRFNTLGTILLTIRTMPRQRMCTLIIFHLQKHKRANRQLQEKMALSEKRSRAELSSFVESYWSYQGRAQEELILFPDGTFNIIYASAPLIFMNEGRSFKLGFYLVPLAATPIRLFSNRAIYGVRFKAFSLPNILKGKDPQLTSINALDQLEISTTAFHHLSTELKRQGEPEEILTLLETLAYELLRPDLRVHESLREKVNYILHRRGQVRIEKMAADFGVSRQGLHKHFMKSLSTSPKQLSAIWQLNHFFALSAGSDDSLTGRALDAGYYDQAHFNHQFSSTFGSAPSAFIRSNSEVLRFAKDSMIKRFSNYYDPEI